MKTCRLVSTAKPPLQFWYQQYTVIKQYKLDPVSRRVYQLFYCSYIGKPSSRGCSTNQLLMRARLTAAELLPRLSESVKLFALWEAHRETPSASLSESRLENKGLQLIYRGVIYISLNQYLKIYTVCFCSACVFLFKMCQKGCFFFFFYFSRMKNSKNISGCLEIHFSYRCLAIEQFKGILLNFSRKWSSSINTSMSIFK